MGLLRTILVASLGLAAATVAWGGKDRPTEFTNQTSIINTRHNMTQRDGSTDLLSTLTWPTYNNGSAGWMDDQRNNYGQVCVYCHTPHGANAAAGAPLWNRALPATTYTTYNQLVGTTVEQTYSQPGGASLSCLSCHDGQQAIDAIMNMPGSGLYSTSPNNSTFLNLWGPYPAPVHAALNSDGCLACHTPTAQGTPGPFPSATDFTVFVVGTDLRNDHPVGVTYPTANGSGTDWNTPSGTKTVAGRIMKFFDETPNGRLDKNEIRLYPAANGPSVECATCHDPHGVPSAGPGSTFTPTFLRKPIAGSNLCLTCHAK